MCVVLEAESNNYMIEWMYSETPGADPRNIYMLAGHIGHS